VGIDFPLLPTQASTVAGPVDLLGLVLLGLSLFFAFGVAGLIIYFGIKYRRRSDDHVPAPTTGSNRIEIAWIAAPLGLALIVFYFATRLYLHTQDPPPNAIPIFVVARQWWWSAQHQEGQQEMGELHVPVGEPVRLTMISQDVIHDFYVPDFRLHADVLPGRYTTLWFEATQPGSYRLFCSQYCGLNHANMTGLVIAMDPRDFATWLSSGSYQSPAAAGAALFQQLGCNTCHRADSERRAPVLSGLYGQPVRLTTGEIVIADDNYLRESILDPNAQIVEGYQPIMPTFRGRVSEDQVNQLIAYIRSLGSATTTLPPVSPPNDLVLTPVPRPPAPEANQ
jgi:cytochrome c oxidase subunit 2